MNKNYVLRSKITVITIFSVLMVTSFVLIFVFINHDEKSENVKVQLKTKILNTDFKNKQEIIENKFKYMYEGARTISLLPSVRQIQGENRSSADEDVVKQGRFSEDAHTTVQQIYNNLANNVSVSEVYSVVEGLDYKKGQVPFFMYDSVIFQKNTEDNSANEVKSSDTPKEDEDFEYEYYPKQIQLLKDTYGKFNFKSLDEIPAIFSPVMRTCDNTQYTSISKGNVKDADGILYSVPFYGMDNNMKGIISVIFRSNTLEADLLDVPFLIITDEDKANAKEQGFSMPKTKGNYLLYNEKYNIYIYDRRNVGLSNKIIKAISNKDTNIINEKVKIKGDSDWKLAYLITDTEYSAATSSENGLYKITVLVTIAVCILAIILVVISARRKEEKKILNSTKDAEKNLVISDFSEAIKQVSRGDLNVSIKTDGAGALGKLTMNFDELMRNLISTISLVKVNSDTLKNKSEQLEVSMDTVSGNSQELTANSDIISNEVKKLAETVNEIYETSLTASIEAEKTKKYAEEGGGSINNTLNSMKNINSIVKDSFEAVRELDEKSKAIGDITSVINAIAKQTNLLALNAAIEASRAGEHGKGFEVVASEIRKLALMTSESTSSIEKLISDTINKSEFTLKQMETTSFKVEESVKLADEAENKLSQIVDKIQMLVNSIENIKDSTKNQSEAVKEISNQGIKVSTNASQTSKSIEESLDNIKELSNISKKLNDTIKIFKL